MRRRNRPTLSPEEPIQGEQATGVIRLHPRGFGFVQPEHPVEHPQEIFVPKHLIDNAVDGDLVEVEINPHSNWEKGPEGKVTAILKRGRSRLGGTIHNISPRGTIYAYCPLLGSTKSVVVESKRKFKIGDRVILKVLEWGDEVRHTVGEVIHEIGNIENPLHDNEAAIEEYDLHSSFPKAAIDQAQGWGSEVSESDLRHRENLIHLNPFTIDPESAKDFDDAVSLSQDKKGEYHLGVHIADVAHYVPANSPLDKEAQQRCNSTYFPGFCLPMLPHDLSDHLCSLRPNVIRLTVSVLMTFDKEGTLLNSRITRSYIESCKRLTYEEARVLIDGKKKTALSSSLKLMVKLCYLLKQKRYGRGSIDFSLPELVIIIDEKGAPSGYKLVEYDISHQLIEEFMLKANEIVAKSLADRGKPALFRIHEVPSKENIEEFYTLARSLGFALPPKPTQKDLQELFEKAKTTPFGQQLSMGFIRSMKLAYYSPENVGHYGLALEHYCHFTSPIRRYTDLVIQRLLFDEEDPELTAGKVALKCSEQERISFRAENSVKILKKLRLVKKWMTEDHTVTYDAVITRIKPFGLFFEFIPLMLEGFLHISELENDYFLFDPKNATLTGRATGKKHAVGEHLTVRPLSIDLILLESKWELVYKKRK